MQFCAWSYKVNKTCCLPLVPLTAVVLNLEKYNDNALPV